MTRLGLVTAAVAALACNSDRLLDDPGHGEDHPELTAVAIRLLVDVEHGTVRVLPPGSTASRNRGSPSFAILGTNEVAVTSSNLVRSAPVNNKVTVTFDAAITNRLTSSSLIPSTFPGSTMSSGLLLFPFKVTQAVGGNASQVLASTDWDGDGTPGSGAPRNFFNDFGCTAGGLSDCYRWEQYPAPLGPGETTAARKVGFTLPRSITSFTVLMVLAADIGNDLPAVAAIQVTPPSYVMNNGFPAGFSAVAYDALNNPLPWARLTWTTADITALEFQNGGALVGVITGPSQVVHGRKVGQTSFTVSSGGIKVVVPVDIQVNTVALVQLYTPDSSITVGDQIQGDVRIKDHSGGIIPGFQATWSTTDGNVITVDQNGLITAVGPGTADVTATAALQSASVTITVSPGANGTLLLTVKDQVGNPVANVDVVAGNFIFYGATAADGTASLSLPPGSAYQIDATKYGTCGGASATGITVVSGQTTPLSMVISCHSAIHGVVTPQNVLLPDLLYVVITPDDGSPPWYVSVEQAAYGTGGGFFIPPGGYSVTLAPINAGCAAVSVGHVDAVAQGDLAVDFQLDCPKAGSVRGTVIQSGQPTHGAFLSLQDVDGSTYGYAFTAALDGSYLFGPVPAGSYYLTAVGSAFCGAVQLDILDQQTVVADFTCP